LREDRPLLIGRGQYVHELQMLGMLHAVFASSTRLVGLSGIDGIMFMPKLFFCEAIFFNAYFL
jgi:hypothetical protein